jgi:hypothetical protein
VTGITSATHPEEAVYYPSAGPRFSWDPAVADGSTRIRRRCPTRPRTGTR